MSSFPKETISYKYFFNADEKSENAQNLAQAQVGRVELEDEKKAITSEFKAKIDAATSTVNLLSRQVIDGYTTKSGLFAKRKNFATMQWEWFDEETSEVVKREPLTGKDRQQDIPFTEPAKPEPFPWDEVHDAVVTPEVEDMGNGQDSQPEPYILEAAPNTLALGPGDQSDEDGDDEPDPADFDPDTYNPEPPTPPTPPKNKGGRPRKNK